MLYKSDRCSFSFVSPVMTVFVQLGVHAQQVGKLLFVCLWTKAKKTNTTHTFPVAAKLLTESLFLCVSVSDGDFSIVPTRLQLFEYESVSFQCMGFDDLTPRNILRNTKTEITTCGFSWWGVSTDSSCTIRGAYPDDSGEYWCEDGGGKRSNSVNITVTGTFTLKLQDWS